MGTAASANRRDSDLISPRAEALAKENGVRQTVLYVTYKYKRCYPVDHLYSGTVQTLLDIMESIF